MKQLFDKFLTHVLGAVFLIAYAIRELWRKLRKIGG